VRICYVDGQQEGGSFDASHRNEWDSDTIVLQKALNNTDVSCHLRKQVNQAFPVLQVFASSVQIMQAIMFWVYAEETFRAYVG